MTGAGSASGGRSHPHSAAIMASSATTAKGTAVRCFHPTQPGPSACCVPLVGTVKAESDRASANSDAEAKRSAGSFSSDLATAAATLGGTDFRSAVTGAASSAMIFMMICCAELPM